jgi:hypothetical protein
MSGSSRLLLVRAGAAVPALAPLSPVAAEPFPDRVPLADGSRPEGIAGGPGTTYFAGSRLDGAVYTGDLRTGSRRPLAPGTPGGMAVGMRYDPATGLVWVAGGTTGTVTAYDGRTGEQVLRAVAPAAAAARFLNDVEVTRDRVYVTDSRNPELLVVDKATGSLSRLPLGGDWSQAPAPANSANGIRAVPSGDLLVVNRGALYLVDATTGSADRVETTGPALTAGDGLELVGDTLYVVFGFGRSTLAVVSLGAQARTAVVRGELPVVAARPTTMTVAAGRGWVVDGNFATANAPDSEHDVVQVALRR